VATNSRDADAVSIKTIDPPGRIALAGLRLIAFMVDFAVFALPIMYSHKTWALPAYDMHALGLVAVSFFVLLGACEWKFGSTPGKVLMHLRVVDESGHYPGLWQAVMRRCLLVIDLLLGGIVGAVSIIITEKAQRIGDLATDTYVRIKIRKWLTRARTS